MAPAAAESKPNLRPKEKMLDQPKEEALDRSRMDARVLLWFATREGKKVAERVLSNIVSAESQLRRGERNTQVEGRFWTAFRDLAAAVKPASVESILSTCRHPFHDYVKQARSKLGNARSTKRLYAWAAVIVLIGLLLLQTYWFVMTTFSASLEKNRDELDSIAGALRVMNVLDSHQKVSLPNNARIEDLLRNDREGLLTNHPTLAAIISTQEARMQLISILNLDLKNKSYRRQRLTSQIRNETAVLEEPWKILWYLFVKPPDVGILVSLSDGDAIGKASSTVAVSTPVAVKIVDPEREFRAAKLAFQAFVAEEEKQINTSIRFGPLEHILSQSKSMPAILSQYFLPMLYGLLGSLTWILRALAKEIQDVTFTRGSASRYSLRWPLGMLAGVTVGLFFDPARFSGLAAITPLGIAFLAGYGVELFFTGLDGLVRAFTGEGPERPKAEAV